MNISNRFSLLFLLMLVGMVSCATDSGSIETESTGEVNSGWKIPFDGSGSKPVVHDGTIYIGSFDGAVYAINPKDGKHLWRYQTGMSAPKDNVIYISKKSFGDMLGTAINASKNRGRREIQATPVIENEVIYIGSRDHSFYALDAKKGKLKWATYLDHQILEKAIITSEHIIVHGYKIGAGDEAVFVLNKKDGTIKWSTLGIGSVTPPAIIENTAYLTNEPKAIVTHISFRPSGFAVNALKIDTGKLSWSLSLIGRQPSRPIISQNIIYVTAFTCKAQYDCTGHVYAVNASTGKLEWEFMGGDVGYSPKLVIESKNIFFTTKEGLYAFDKNTGEQVWFLEGKFSPNNIFVDKFLYVQGDSLRKNNQIYAINPNTGKVNWNYADKNIFYTNLVADTLYFSAKKSMVALNASTGKKLWKYKTGSFSKEGANIAAASIVFEGNLIFPTQADPYIGIQGHLYSIDARTGKVK